ncbi:MFS transporter [Xanthomonas oryzae pv. oryzicola]|uniref:MFS transporter n=1 Tax=Xanthomonas oryzae TaxID=347 RepID=UPI0006560D7E|nr:MFS transporter [Xanthomonas oryzae]AKN94456.1 citrate-proton symporter [Xanthomonas oryzae pv. oryzicola]AKO13405.1 citrate-proton symporter [Xanthomonas oryzae pv. oryzicola]AKO17146.1 citrate-proton symporter [Xanthomonas oryzae pv. oryzicola]
MHTYRGGRLMQTSRIEGKPQSKLGMVLRVTSGNFLEQFDFFLFGFYATQIAAAFFPASNEFASLMMTFAVFGAGFLMRPLGAVILGAYIDDVGRRKGLIVTLAIMASGTVLIVLVPGYASIGLWAPALVLLGRLLQGFSAGAELGGVSVYLAEMATPGRRGFYASWQSASQQLAIVAAAAIGFALNQLMAPQDLAQWGWRIPFGIGCVIIPFIFLLRRSLEETAEFAQRRQPVTMKQVMRGLANNASIVIAGGLMVALTTTAFYLITVYAPTFGKTVLKLSTGDALIVTLLVGVSNFMWLPIGGTLSDRFGRKPLLVTMSVMCILTAYPVLAFLAAAPSFAHMLQALLWLSFIYGLYNGAMIPALTEQMPAHVRVAGFSLAYSLATAVFGGFTPVISTWLIHVTGDKAAPGYWLIFASVCALAATLFLYRRQGNPATATGLDAAAEAKK